MTSGRPTFEEVRATWIGAADEAAPAALARLTANVDLADHQTDLLHELLLTARERAPWHAERLRGIDIDSITSTDLSALPTMTKADVMAAWDASVTDPELTLDRATAHLHDVERTERLDFCLGRYLVIATGGTTGRRGVFAHDVRSFAAMFAANRASVAARQALPNIPAPRREIPVQARVVARAPTHLSAAFTAMLGGAGYDAFDVPATQPRDEIVARLNDIDPDVLVTYPSVLQLLAQEALAGRLRVRPTSILCAGEPLLPETAAIAEQAFGLGVRNQYGASEVMIGDTARPGDRPLLVWEHVLIEVVDEHNEPVAPGKRGTKILLTNLHNHLQPLIRYELSDEVTEYVGPPPVPWSGHWIEPPIGRMDDWFSYGDAAVHPQLFRSRLTNEPSIVEYQVVQTPTGASIHVVAERRFDVREVVERLEADLALHIANPVVTVDVVDALERHAASGKLRRFVPLDTRR